MLQPLFPIFILHGEHDSAAPMEQAPIVNKKLVDAGIDTKL
jgi:hypothetical protein